MLKSFRYFISKLFLKNWDQRSLKIHITINTGLYITTLWDIRQMLRNEQQIGCFGQITG